MATGSANTWGIADLLGSVAFKYAPHKSAGGAPSCRLTRLWIPICFAAATASGYLCLSLTTAYMRPWSLQSNSQTALARRSGVCSTSNMGTCTEFLNITALYSADLISNCFKLVRMHRSAATVSRGIDNFCLGINTTKAKASCIDDTLLS